MLPGAEESLMMGTLVGASMMLATGEEEDLMVVIWVGDSLVVTEAEDSLMLEIGAEDSLIVEIGVEGSLMVGIEVEGSLMVEIGAGGAPEEGDKVKKVCKVWDKVGREDEVRMDFEVVEQGAKDKLGQEAGVRMAQVIEDYMMGHGDEDSKMALGEEEVTQVVDEAEEQTLFNLESGLLNLLKVSKALL